MALVFGLNFWCDSFRLHCFFHLHAPSDSKILWLTKMKRQQTIAGLLPLMTYKKTGSVIVHASSLFLIALDFFTKIFDLFAGKTRKLYYVFYRHSHLQCVPNNLNIPFRYTFLPTLLSCMMQRLGLVMPGLCS